MPNGKYISMTLHVQFSLGRGKRDREKERNKKITSYKIQQQAKKTHKQTEKKEK